MTLQSPFNPIERVSHPPRRIVPVTFSRDKSPNGKSSEEKSIYQATLAWALKEDYESLVLARNAFLHPNELTYFETLRFDHRQRSYLLGRYAGKEALMQLGGLSHPAQIEIAAGIFTQPIVKPGRPEPVGISLSHCEEVACALAFPEEHPAAIDIEETAPDRSEVMKTQILPRELERASVAWGSGPNHPAIIWTAKEALSKVLRCGMMCPFELFAVNELSTGHSAGHSTRQDFYGGQFENFGQYRFQSWVMGTTVLSIVCPRNSAMIIDMEPLIQAMARRPIPASI